GPKGASSLLAAFILKGPHGQAGCDDPEVRIAAVVALREIDTDESIGYLILVIDDPDRNVRGEAVTSLANAAYPWVVPALLQALADPVVPIRKVAAEGMKRITKVGLSWKEDAAPEVRGTVAQEWERWYDSWRRQRDWSMECGRMNYAELSSKIDELMAARPEPQRAAWNRLHALLATFRDDKATPTPTADMISKPIDDFLPMVYDDMNIWMAVVILEIQTGTFRGVMPPDRMKSKR
ncbi:MAG: HEAT repeat domain-containing protein, partial [Planctomycetes bacterium]|nr:HEAT repeat domain-containing protein [Planctomycetota bacterium]